MRKNAAFLADETRSTSAITTQLSQPHAGISRQTRQMRAIVTAALAASLAAAVVFELDPDNFDASITSGGPWIVEFYAPWCTHCKRLEPHFEAASRAKEAAGARFGRVDGAAHRSLLMRFGVAGFPTIFHIDASGAVRPATINHSKQALVTLAKNGINATQALTGVANPNGPAKLAIFLFLKYGEKGERMGGAWEERALRATS